jgi:hypothetical protein
MGNRHKPTRTTQDTSRQRQSVACGTSRGNILPVPITDTDPAAHAIQLQIQRAMTGEQRVLLALEMSLFAREVAASGIRLDHPEWTDAQIARELLRRSFLPEPLPPGLR